jgi:hypothetical protein
MQTQGVHFLQQTLLWQRFSVLLLCFWSAISLLLLGGRRGDGKSYPQDGSNALGYPASLDPGA